MTHSTITRISYLKDLMTTLRGLDNDALVLFDVDDVILMDQDEYRLTHHCRKKIIVETKARISREHKLRFFSTIFKNRKVRFVDEDFLGIFQTLDVQQIPTMALTKLYTGKFGIIDDFTEWRINELNSCNVDFLKLSPIKHEILAHELENRGGIPTLKDGIILTADLEKGLVLEYFLEKANYIPKTIIFVDDLIENIEAVADSCRKLGIKYHGFEFVGAAAIPEIDHDEMIERRRFEILEKEGIWITDNNLIY